MTSLSRRLREALVQGAALASAGVYAGCASSAPQTTDAASDASSPIDAAMIGLDATKLEPYPIDRIDCYGEDHQEGFGFHGRCCVRAQCYSPGAPSCPRDPGSAVPGYPPGSGSCGCAATAGQTVTAQGPYAPNPEHTPEHEGACCYLVASISCDGRPLIVDDSLVVAPIAVRSDWLVRA